MPPPTTPSAAPNTPATAASIGHLHRLLPRLLFILSCCCSQSNRPSVNLGDVAPNRVIYVILTSLFPPSMLVPHPIIAPAIAATRSYPLPH
ncbi:hypothetical protein BHM03_00016178 [Ensete ventricosum]|nr:hypothetical protein BHM03_00016178 [Ensete ventricosum]